MRRWSAGERAPFKAIDKCERCTVDKFKRCTIDTGMFVYEGRRLPKPQRLFQRFDRDCGVCVFGELAGVSYDQVLRDLPGAHLGNVRVDGWMQWLKDKGLSPLKCDGAPTDIVPCAHLVASKIMYSESDCHWIYRDADGDVHDPAPTYRAMWADDEKMRAVSFFYGQQICTISISQT